MRSTFQETVLHETSIFKKISFLGFFGRAVLGVSEEIAVSFQGFWLGTVTKNVARVPIKHSVQSDKLISIEMIIFTRICRKSPKT